MSVDPASASAQPASLLAVRTAAWARTDADAPRPPSPRRRGDGRMAVQ
ncbi:TPA: hypothetical protein ACXNP2_000393 [Stenotrophomonas maltophilia]